MVCRTGMIIVVLCILMLAGCSTDAGEEKTMEDREPNAAELICDELGCGLRTAQSIEKQCHMAGIGEITAVCIQEDIYTILELVTEEDKYYVYLADGYFLEQIRKGSENGEKIYTAME